MRLLLWNVARVVPAEKVQPPPPTTDVCIVLTQGPDSYSFEWMVRPKARLKRLNKREIHELTMKVTKHVDTLNLMPSATPVKSTVFASL